MTYLELAQRGWHLVFGNGKCSITRDSRRNGPCPNKAHMSDPQGYLLCKEHSDEVTGLDTSRFSSQVVSTSTSIAV